MALLIDTGVVRDETRWVEAGELLVYCFASFFSLPTNKLDNGCWMNDMCWRLFWLIRVVSSSRVESSRDGRLQCQCQCQGQCQCQCQNQSQHFLFFADRLLENATNEETHMYTILLYAYGTLPCHYMLCCTVQYCTGCLMLYVDIVYAASYCSQLAS